MRVELSAIDCYSGMVVAWNKGDRIWARRLAEALVTFRYPRRKWLANAVAILQATALDSPQPALDSQGHAHAEAQ